MNILIWIIIVSLLLDLVHTKYSVTVYNCLDPQDMRRYERSSMCADQTTESTTTDFVVAQAAKTHTLQGFSCSLKFSEWKFKCGAWSHLKVGGVPKVLHHREVSPEWCREMVSRKKFKLDSNLDSRAIHMDRTNIYPIVVVGSLKETADKVICQGEAMHYDNALHTNLVILREFHLTLRRESFRSDGKKLEALSVREQLPCSVQSRGCVTEERTYIFDPPN